MRVLKPIVARHLFPTQIYLLLEHMGIVGLRWDILGKIKGTWMTAYGVDGEVRLTEDDNLKSIGKHIAAIYGNDTTFICHKVSSTLRIKFSGPDMEKIVSVADGPHCCAKHRPVRYVQSGDEVSEVVEHPGGRTNVFKMDSNENVRFISPSTEVIYDSEEWVRGYKVRDREFEYLDYDGTRVPTAIMTGTETVSSYDLTVNADGRVTKVSAGATVLLDLSEAWDYVDSTSR